MCGFPCPWTDVVRRRSAPDDARRRAELDSLQETALLLAERLDPESLLSTIVERAGELLGTEHGYLYLCHHDDETLTVKIGTGAFARQIGYRLRFGDGVAGRVAKTGEPLAVDDTGSWPDGRATWRASRSTPPSPFPCAARAV